MQINVTPLRGTKFINTNGNCSRSSTLMADSKESCPNRLHIPKSFRVKVVNLKRLSYPRCWVLSRTPVYLPGVESPNQSVSFAMDWQGRLLHYPSTIPNKMASYLLWPGSPTRPIKGYLQSTTDGQTSVRAGFGVRSTTCEGRGVAVHLDLYVSITIPNMDRGFLQPRNRIRI